MIRNLKTVFATILIVLFATTSCKKDESNDLNKNDNVKILKMADNSSFERPIIFEYNTNGQLTKVTDESDLSESGGLIRRWDITYDDSDKPVKVIESYKDVNSFYVYTDTTLIEWHSDGFSLINLDDMRYFENYEPERCFINNVGQIISDPYYRYKYFSNESVYVYNKHDNSLEYKVIFSDKFSPFKNINLALRYALDGLLSIGEMEFNPFPYLPSEIYWGWDIVEVFEIDEEFNNYPTRIRNLDSDYYIYFQYQ
ncbi:MAG: hypothetical protein ACPL1A_10255 [Candidatus Kapaibacteriota bacterium]